MLHSSVVATVVLALLYFVLKRVFGSHPLDKIPGPKPASWWNGHFDEIFGVQGLNFHFMFAEKYGPTFSFKTFYGERQLYTFDPKAMHHILVKQGNLFEEAPSFLYTMNFTFGGGLLGTLGEPHRKQRKMLNPIFSIAHMRQMVPIFYEVAHRLRNTLVAKVQDGPQQIDMLSWTGHTALELVGKSGFGYSFDSLADEEHAHPYVCAMKSLVLLISRAHFTWTYIFPYISRISMPGIRRFIARFLPWKDFQEAKRMSEYIWALSKEVFEAKRDSVNRLGKELGGKDILSVLIQENEKASGEDRLDDDELIAQITSSTLIFAAMDTTSSALSRILLLLATHPEVQEKLGEEINDAFQGSDIPYNQLVSLPYLDAIVRETMRVYPPIHWVLRTAIKDTVLPLSTPVICADGSAVNEIFIPCNMDIKATALL
ncbi:cytochrome P450 [Marasmius fiardii PR-910]|nr:cytochrome P450 [Marasmius fiardii PR-910]